VSVDLAQLQRNHGGALCRGVGPHQGATILIATGIECSYPTVQGGRRRDELEETGHYSRWREDIELCRQLGARYLRYGLPYYLVHTSPGTYDWRFSDEVLPAIWEAGLIPILDLCHFGTPDWIGGFQDSDWPRYFAEYAGAVAERYPWIKFFTPVNEMLICARFSARLGLWNEQAQGDGPFVRAHANQCEATLRAIEAIQRHRPDAVFVQSETAEVYLEQWPKTATEVAFHNHLRFITFDFVYGRPCDADVLLFLLDNGLTRDRYDWFMARGRSVAQNCVLGMDYYGNNERTIEPDGTDRPQGAMLGWGMIAQDYYERYRRPMMLTETNFIDGGEASVHWLLRTWHQARHLRNRGVPVIGYTWYSLTDQIDWDIQLREIRGKVNANGLVTLDRREREVARVFRQLARDYACEPLLHTLPPNLTVGRAGEADPP
jgi:beta-glucosidase/6-phospho-beta-glucosidase/beta-galactosidase